MSIRNGRTRTPATISTTYRAHPSRVQLGEFLRPTPRQQFKRAVRELEEQRVRETAMDICCYVMAIGLVVALIVAYA